MTAQSLTMTLAGTFVLLSLILAHVFGQVDLSQPSWLWFTLFVGANLFQAGLTGFCPLTKMLKKLGFS